MTIQELFIGSNQALRKVVDQIGQGQWELPMPPFASGKPLNLIDAVRYHTYDDAWVPDILAGKKKEEVGDKYDSLLQTDAREVKATYDKYNEAANQAVGSFSELERITHLSYGDFPANEYLQHIISFRAFHAYDIAKLIGIDTKMEPDLVDGLLDEFSTVIEDYRKMGVFPPAIKVPVDASPQKKLLALAGRR